MRRQKILFILLLLYWVPAHAVPFFQVGANVGGSLSIEPRDITLPASTTQTFFSNGGRGSKTYSIVSGGGSINSTTGVFTAPGTGSTTVVRVTDSAGATANTTVVTIGVVAITVSQGYVAGGIGGTVQIYAQALMSPSGSTDITNSATWATTNASVATVSNGLISFVSGGTATVSVTYGGYTQNVSVNVANKSLVSIAVTPSTKSMGVNATEDFVATATYSDSSTEDISDTVTWSSSNPAVASISNTAPFEGRATGLSAGTSTLSATIGSISGSATLTVTAATLSSITITPDATIIGSSSTLQFTATGTFSDASTSDITAQVTWSSSNTSAATISNVAGSKGLATSPSFSGFRSTTITATLGAVSDTTSLSVNGTTVTSILVTPTVTITVGSTFQMQAIANLSDGGSLDVTTAANWSSGTPARVTVSNSVGHQGKVQGISVGTSTVTATYGGQSGNKVVTVGASEVVTEEGTGLLGEYYNWSGGSPPANAFTAGNKTGQRIDANVAFNWGTANSPMGVAENYAVRWTGEYKALSTNNYFCTRSDDGVRVWLNGVQIINNWTAHAATWNCSNNRVLTVGNKYSLRIEFFEQGGDAVIQFTRSSTSQGDAQNATTRIVPQSSLYPP